MSSCKYYICSLRVKWSPSYNAIHGYDPSVSLYAHYAICSSGLLATLQFPQTLGFIGGKPNHAIYFIGNHGNDLLGLDPHTVQPAPQVSFIAVFVISSSSSIGYSCCFLGSLS